MREENGDLFEVYPDAFVIPTNTQTTPIPIRRDIYGCRAVMGAGLARQAAKKYEWLAAWLGERIVTTGGEHIYAIKTDDDMPYLICLPTKRHWKNPSDLYLIVDMVKELKDLTRMLGWSEVTLPRLGCGYGGLDWEREVKPILSGLLDNRFVVVHKEG